MKDFTSHPSGTGSYQIMSNTSDQLKITAFDNFFGYRALIDEVNIWVLAGTGQPSELSLKLTDDDEHDEITESRLEDGCYFLLFDQRSELCHRPEVRSWLSSMLSPVELLWHTPTEYHQRWFPAWGLVPGLHCHTPRTCSARPNGIDKITLTSFTDHPEHSVIQTAIRSLFANHGIEVIFKELPYMSWCEGEGNSDIWLGSACFPQPVSFSLMSHYLSLPLFQLCIPFPRYHV